MSDDTDFRDPWNSASISAATVADVSGGLRAGGLAKALSRPGSLSLGASWLGDEAAMASYFFLDREDGEFEVRCHHAASQSQRCAGGQSRLQAGSGRIEVDV